MELTLTKPEAHAILEAARKSGNSMLGAVAEKIKTAMRPKSGLSKINTEQGLYVLHCGAGYSCLGFEVAERRRRAVVEWLEPNNREPVPPFPLGTELHFKAYEQAMRAGAEHNRITGARCPADLTPQLIGLEGKRVEVTTPDGEKSRFWVGKSSGWMPIHLEIKRRNSHGGGSVYVPEGSTVRVVATR